MSREIDPENRPDCEEPMSRLSRFPFLEESPVFFTRSNPFSSILVYFRVLDKAISGTHGSKCHNKKQNQT